jgi:hypothetical protein
MKKLITVPEESKWAQLAREVEGGAMSLGASAAKRFSKARKEFREGFQFKHDKDELENDDVAE